MATRTTTIRTTISEFGPSADHSDAGLTVDELLCAYYDCRRRKRTTINALQFETNLERNIMDLYRELVDGSYRPGTSICFVITRPRPREVWAADFRDRVVHHLLYNRIADRFHRSFIADSCACIPGRGTLYGATRLEHKIRSITRNWSQRAYYLKLDLANFFVSIDKNILRDLLAKKIDEPWTMWLADTILFHDPRENVRIKGAAKLLALIPPHKSLFNQPAHLGLPIGNLSSQFFANVYMDAVDQYVKHRIKARHYIRYVDDMILLHESPEWLNNAAAEIGAFVTARLAMRLNPRKTILQPIERGVDFVGQIIKPWRRVLRRKTFENAIAAVSGKNGEDLMTSANSYLGLLRQSDYSHSARARLLRIALSKGHCVNYGFTKVFRKRMELTNP
jgi:RNA-directed DNA polymerase